MIYRAKVGGTLYIYDEETRDSVEAKMTASAKRTGEAIEFPDRKMWFDYEAIVDLTKSGSDQYIWAADGNQVQHWIVKNTLRGGVHQRETIGMCFRELD